MSVKNNSLRYKSIDVAHTANIAPTTLNTEGDLFTGYSKITGIAVNNFGAHTKFKVGINNQADNIEVDAMGFPTYSQNAADGRFLPVDIDLDGSKVINIKTQIREQVNSAIDYEVIVRLER